MTDADLPTRPEVRPRRGRAWLRRGILLLVAVLVVVAMIRFTGRIDWAGVAAALGHLTWWQPILLLALLVVRQALSAAPLAFHIPDVGLGRALVNDVGAHTMAAFAPAPADMVLRIAMFRTWGYDTSQATAGTVMNAMTLFIVRFGVPLAGFALVIATGAPLGLRLLDLISLATCTALVTGLLLLVRTERWARAIGAWCGSVASRFRRDLDVSTWADACVTFRGNITARFARAFPRGILTMCGVVIVDAVMLTACLRFVGVTAQTAPITAVAIAFLFAYPLTAFPMQGLGAVDVLILASLVQTAGLGIQDAAVAALAIWRVFTVGGPFLLGLGAIAAWRRMPPRGAPA